MCFYFYYLKLYYDKSQILYGLINKRTEQHQNIRIGLIFTLTIPVVILLEQKRIHNNHKVTTHASIHHIIYINSCYGVKAVFDVVFYCGISF